MLELWGGHECTVNRIRDGYRDQTLISGHEARIEDLDLFAALGCRALRYPVLWERVSPQHPDQKDWTWSDARLERLRTLSIRPIVGLTHHGSGPSYTHLLDPGFASGLAAHAEAVARRYEWIEDWTPVNEPLTTARFSALYGHWFPHATDDGAFWLALVNQVDAVRLSMQAIRRVNPEARLIQTEDLGRTYGTAPLHEQVAFENLRRWLTWDLLTGRVNREHGLFERLAGHGLGDRLLAIADAPCPPDVLGVNHYLTSERFLDHRLERYPPEVRGGNERQAYADVEGVRVLVPPPDGLEGVLRESHARYGLPLAVTEVHNGCTREEQMRWLLEAWRTAERLREDGVPMQAVTAWSLLGAFDWDSLLTRSTGHYEPGAFDVRGPIPRRTGVADLMETLTQGVEPPPAARGLGWWRRDIRLEYQPVRRSPEDPPPQRFRAPGGAPPILIAGWGWLSDALAGACLWRGLEYRVTAFDEAGGLGELIDAERPWAVISAVEPSAVEVEPISRWAAACAVRGIPFMAFSSDLVFDGRAARPYLEHDLVGPNCAEGERLAAMEARLLAMDARVLIARFGPCFSAYDKDGFAVDIARALRRGERFEALEDALISPTDRGEMIDAALDLLIDGERGVRHLANTDAVSWAEFGRRIAGRLGLDGSLIRPRWLAEFETPQLRPCTALGSARGAAMRSLDLALDRYARALTGRD
jgi:dTDP-4-dehydrorhamnose reductase